MEFDLLIVDDNSPDGTGAVCDELREQYNGTTSEARKPFDVIHRTGKAGLGTAYVAGMTKALDDGADFVVQMDADFSHNPVDLGRLLQKVQSGSDLAIGSRYVKGGKVTNWPTNRVLLSKYASIYVRLITWMPVRDTTAGFVCYHRRVLETLNLSKIRFVGYAFQIEMKFAAWKLGFRLAEVPINFVDRVAGSSKLSKGIFKEAVLGVWEMKFRSMWMSYRNTTP